MTVIAIPKRGQGSGRRRLRGIVQHTSESRAGTSAPAPDPQPTQAVTRRAPGRSPRDATPPQDHAVYTCQCGFVFEALVSTSVECPHCGTGQAW